jgi:hypothetical protein
MRIRLNGWQSIGIVLSVIAFIGFAGYAAYVLYEDQEDILVGRFAEVRGQCEEKLKSPSHPYSTVGTPVKIRQRCFSEAHARFLEDTFAIAFGTVLLSWLVSWFGIVAVMRWTR